MTEKIDIKLEEKSLALLAKHFDEGDVFAVSGKFYDFDETTFLYGNRGGYFRDGHFFLYEKGPDDDSQTLFACGGAFMVDRKRYLDLGGFDLLYHPLCYEEIDLSYRALKRGWEVRYEPESIPITRCNRPSPGRRNAARSDGSRPATIISLCGKISSILA
jgi:GT2 family glycosyltransferase